MTRSDLSDRNNRLNPVRTHDEQAAFKAANNDAASARNVTPRQTHRRPTKGFKIIWQTSLGRFGWVTFEDCRNIDEAMDAFQAARRDDNDLGVPFDACIDTIKPIS